MIAGTALLDLVGTLRACRPDETLARIRPMFPTFGLTRLARVTGLDRIGVEVTIAVRPLSRSLTVSQGKGLTAELADASAAMESIELWHAEHLAPPDAEGTFSRLAARHAMVDPSELPPGLYRGRADLRETPAGWYRGTDLITGHELLVPDYAIDVRADEPRPEWATVLCTTNGLASGNTRDEAICHALLEVIERDGVAHLERDPGRAATAEVDLASVDGPARPIVDRLLEVGMRVRVHDATSAAGVPTFACRLRGDAELRGLATCVGQGAHLSRDIALLRALTEAVQSRLTLITGSRDDLDSSRYAEMRRSAHEEPPLAGSAGTRAYPSLPSPEIPGSFPEIVADLTRRVRNLGARHAVVVDLTKPELGVPVVFVLVPGLQQLQH
ncbi:MAG: YcaO-like family protein [Deltaproteobacteria bacterium]|nr:YcaO-like family protein [Deltaproteobacteria bacterium]